MECTLKIHQKENIAPRIRNLDMPQRANSHNRHVLIGIGGTKTNIDFSPSHTLHITKVGVGGA